MLEEKILSDYKEALKARDALRSTLLSSLRAEIMNTAIAKKKARLEEAEILALIRRFIKQHQDSIEQFKQGNRQDLVDKETEELKVLEAYLPPQLAEAQLNKIIDEAISATGAQGLKDMGRLMQELNARLAGQADPRLVSEIVRQRLSSKKL
jgi:uncharacterized protein YqeY